MPHCGRCRAPVAGFQWGRKQTFPDAVPGLVVDPQRPWRTMIPGCSSSGLAGVLDVEAAHQVQTGRTEHHREAAKAFAEKRAPIFTGR